MTCQRHRRPACLREEAEARQKAFSCYDPAKELELKVKRAKIEIQEYGGDQISVDQNKLNEDLTVSSSIKDGKLLISVKGDSEDNEGTLLIKLPKDTAFESLELDLYGGILQVTKIQASDLDLSASAGLIQLSDFQADNMDIECGAGEIRISGRVTQDAILSAEWELSLRPFLEKKRIMIMICPVESVTSKLLMILTPGLAEKWS